MLLLNEEEKMAIFFQAGIPLDYKCIEKEGRIILLVTTKAKVGIHWNGKDFTVVSMV